MSTYVFRINYNECFNLIKSEILNGRLRQGWGCEGTDIRGSFEDFKQAGKKTGEWQESDSWFGRRYNILRIMFEMKAGDIIVVPKINMNENGNNDSSFFTVFKVTEAYKFNPIQVPVWDNFKEFGHIIGVEKLASFSYSLDELTREISAKFKGYQSAVNRVYSEAFISALDELMTRQNNNPKYSNEEDKLTLDVLASSVSPARKELLKSILEKINAWKPGHLEEVITRLFEMNGFIVDSTHKYNKQGGDIDVSFTLKPSYSLISDIALAVSDKFSEVRVQAKKKSEHDANDREGISQLLESEGHENAINILINTTLEFTDEAKEEAAMKKITLISGLEFADLLLKYGLVFF